MPVSSGETPPLPISLIDRFGRRVNYVRFSVTDRCDFSCIYCMSERMSKLVEPTETSSPSTTSSFTWIIVGW